MSDGGRVQGKVAIVTGAARGTGAATARLLAREGARVVLGDLLEEPGRLVAKEIAEAGGVASFERLDVASEDDWRRVVDAAVERHGTVDVLVNNAAGLHMAALEDTALEQYERVVRVNQVGTFLGMKAVAPVMKRAGRGSIVNVSSIDGMSAKTGLVAYSASDCCCCSPAFSPAAARRAPRPSRRVHSTRRWSTAPRATSSHCRTSPRSGRTCTLLPRRARPAFLGCGP